jgi:hypothetical protein
MKKEVTMSKKTASIQENYLKKRPESFEVIVKGERYLVSTNAKGEVNYEKKKTTYKKSRRRRR